MAAQRERNADSMDFGRFLVMPNSSSNNRGNNLKEPNRGVHATFARSDAGSLRIIR